MLELTMPEEKRELYRQLDAQRHFVIDPDTGNVVRREAWAEINRLLDCLNELNALNVEVAPIE